LGRAIDKTDKALEGKLEEQSIEHYVKNNYLHQEQSKENGKKTHSKLATFITIGRKIHFTAP